MKEKKYIVYVHIFPNGKLYFGITCNKPNQRWEGGTGYSQTHQPVMYNAIKKYGWENVEHKILYKDLTYEEANSKEMELIAKYKTNCRKYGDDFGYNMTDGGDGTRGHIVSDESRKRMSKHRLGKTGKDCVNSKPVICDGVEYESLTEFKQKMGVNGQTSNWLLGKCGMPKEWFDKGLRYKDDDIHKPYCQDHGWCNVIIYDGKEYKSQKELADFLNITPSTLCLWLNGKRAIPEDIYNKGLYRKGEKDSYLKSYTPNEEIYYDGQHFKSQRELARYIGIKPGTLWTYINGKCKIPEEYKKKGLKAYK